MSRKKEELLLGLLATNVSNMAKLRRRKKHSCWTCSWILRHHESSFSSTLVWELTSEDEAEYRGMFRMHESDFPFLLNLVSLIVAKHCQAGHIATQVYTS